MSALATLAVLVHLAAAATDPTDHCGSLPRATGGGAIDLAPPIGFVEICKEDAALCRTLTASYPHSVTTLGYFVTALEWASRGKAAKPSFSRYLIAQMAQSKTASQLLEIKSFVRSQQQGVPARARLAEAVETDGQASLGILNDTPDSISIGAVAKLPAAAGGAAGGMIAMTNTALAVGDEMLSLYVYSAISDPKQVEQLELLTKRWLGCVRAANRR